MEDIVAKAWDLLWNDPVISLLVRFLGIGFLVGPMTEYLPEAFPALKGKRPMLSLILGPLLGEFFYIIGTIKVQFDLPGLLATSPPALQATIRVLGIAVLGFLATLLARWFHDFKVNAAKKETPVP